MISPERLSKGDKIIIASPAGAVDKIYINKTKKKLRSWGYSVETAEHACGVSGRYSGTLRERLDDFQKALDDPECKAVLCGRGGYGSVHLIDKISLDAFRKNPKWIIGYSDITMFHSLMQREGYESIHGGMAKSIASDNIYDVKSSGYLKSILSGERPEYFSPFHLLNRPGESEGILRGGNLSILCSLRGTAFDYIPENSILLLEDIGEQPYSVDRMLYNLKLGGVLKRISGLVVGNFSNYEEDSGIGKTLYEIISDAVKDYDYPVCFEFPVGHEGLNLPLIMGAGVRLSVNKNGVKITYKNI